MANRFLSNIRINDAYTFPSTDGTSGQAIVTDGAGNLSFGDVASGADAASVIYRDSFTGDGTTTEFVMEKNVTSEDQTQIYIDGVYQEKDTYSVVGNVITFATAPELNHSIEVMTISGISVGPTVIRQDNFTGDGIATDFTLANTVSDEVKTMVFFNGVYQFKGTYTVAGTLVSFDTAPASGVDIEIITIESASGDRESQRILFYGKASGTISKGDAVMFAGAEGDHFLFAKATQAAIEANHELFIGLANQDFANNEFGYVVEFGRIDGIDTTVYTSTAGTILWYDSASTVPGAITATEPIPPAAKIQVAAVIRLHQNEGSLFVRPTWYHELGELHDVSISSPSDKDLLTYNNATGVWENSKTLDTLTANTLSATTLTGTLSTVSQPNIVSLGTLLNLSVAGDLTVDTNTLYVNSTSNTVGVGTATTFGKLSIDSNGAPAISDNITTGLTVHNAALGTAINVGTNDAGGYSYIQSAYVNSAATAVDLAFFTGPSEHVRVNTIGNIGVGTITPTDYSSFGYRTLEISGLSADRTGALILSDSTGTIAGTFIANEVSGLQIVQPLNRPITFYANNIEQVRFLPTGGITFNGDTASANALDDYEEGTWTPVLAGSTGNPTVSYTTTYTGGVYTKIGNVVHVSFEVRWSSISGGSGDVIISGLPFTRRDTLQPDADRLTIDSYNNTIPGIYLVAGVGRNTNNIGISAVVSGGPTVPLSISNLGNANPTFLRGSVTYFV